jgi:hypothetical protein
MLNSTFHGPAWLTGGSVGPEGSVMTFGVVAIAAILFVIVYPSRTGFSLSGLPNVEKDNSI